MELLSGHEKIITKSGISLNAGTLNRGFTVLLVEPEAGSEHIDTNAMSGLCNVWALAVLGEIFHGFLDECRNCVVMDHDSSHINLFQFITVTLFHLKLINIIYSL
jgi:hypothetical protein